MDDEAKHAGKPLTNSFIPKLKGKKVIIRLVSGGQPITGTIEGYNPYEILSQIQICNAARPRYPCGWKGGRKEGFL